MPSVVNTLNCLILQSKAGLRLIPNHMPVYFINSKRRFFLYFRSQGHMVEAMRLLADHAVRFYRRDSLLPDREEHEEQVFHCNYRFKKVDLRRTLSPTTPYNEPRMHFDRFDRTRSRQELPPNEPQVMPEEVREEEPKEEIVIGGHRFRNAEAARVLMSKELMKGVLFSLNFMPIA